MICAESVNHLQVTLSAVKPLCQNFLCQFREKLIHLVVKVAVVTLERLMYAKAICNSQTSWLLYQTYSMIKHIYNTHMPKNDMKVLD